MLAAALAMEMHVNEMLPVSEIAVSVTALTINTGESSSSLSH
jgi:hypothetical protein